MQKTAHLISQDQHAQILLLTLRGLLRARRDTDFATCVRDAALILPVARVIERGFRLLGGGAIPRYVPFDLVIKFLGLAERQGNSVYLLGGQKEDLEKAEANLRVSFPGLQFVGRYSAPYPEHVEDDLIMAIRKSSPSLLLVGSGIEGRELWIWRHRSDLGPCLALWVDDCFEIFSGRKKPIGRKAYDLGLESLAGLVRRPWRILLVFRHLYFYLLVVIQRPKKRRHKAS